MSELALLSTAGIKDPETRHFLDRLMQAWGRNFALRDDVPQLATEALAGALGGGIPGAAPGSTTTISQAVDLLATSIRNSVAYQILEQPIALPNFEELRTRVQIDLNNTNNAISTVSSNVATVTTSVNNLTTRVGTAEVDINNVEAAVTVAQGGVNLAQAAITSEISTRGSKDTFLASAINRIWSFIGGSTAVIDDGVLAAATPSSAVATKWNQVVAAVTDPNTGLVNSAAILTETRAYANSANNTFNAIYQVKAQIDSAGRTVVGGFALAATAGAGSAGGPTIDFGVLANKFFVAAPASGYDPATQYSTADNIPFIVVTTPTVINGVTFQPGVYMKKALIGEAQIGTLQIGLNQVIVPVAVELAASASITTFNATANAGSMQSIMSLNIDSGGQPIYVEAVCNGVAFGADGSPGKSGYVTIALWVDGVLNKYGVIRMVNWANGMGDARLTLSRYIASPGAGSHTIELRAQVWDSSIAAGVTYFLTAAGDISVNSGNTLIALGMKR